ncbi:MAG: polyribonucleotide nucleotidyltransferase [Deltaproteobacteria bacterium]|nr:MAG: polyribonucleotide nucleotidyltransferase [Deltaproteobacteria bacterium]
MFDVKSVNIEIGGKEITIETGKMARQAHGAVVVSSGESAVLVTAVADYTAKEGIDFFPLTVAYQSKGYSAGKIPGGFFKREGRPPDADTLIARLTDRPIRPLFPKEFRCETQVIITVLSHDGETNPDMLGMLGASASLVISDIPFLGPMAAVRVGMIDGEYVINPDKSRMEESSLELLIAGTADAVTMVESGAKELTEDEMLVAIEAGHVEIKRLVELQNELQKMVGKEKRVVEPEEIDPSVLETAKTFFDANSKEAYLVPGKIERSNATKAAKQAFYDSLTEEQMENKGAYSEAYGKVAKEYVRNLILDDSKRIDGRGLEDVRPITAEVGILPRTHGSALFTRGETQALVLTTLGTSSDEQLIDVPEGSYYKKFLLHYNFPPFSVGEARFLRSPGRREIGHGALAERALKPVLPDHEDFPYTIRLVSEILESNGSSSMASVCGGSLALMDAGIPVSAPVAGIAMGLISDGDRYAVLSDILGDEDHLGDMDFKVAGTEKGITALQMDIKIEGLTVDIMKKALEQARNGRLHILGEMAKAISTPRADLSPHAPRITVITVNTEKIKDVIGPGGKNIRKIIEVSGTTIDINDDGSIHIGSPDGEKTAIAIKMIRDLTQEAEVGKVYEGTVRKIMDFGAFVEIFPGTDGLVHISEIAKERIDRNDIEKFMPEGGTVKVKVLSIDNNGRIKLSRKATLDDE